MSNRYADFFWWSESGNILWKISELPRVTCQQFGKNRSENSKQKYSNAIFCRENMLTFHAEPFSQLLSLERWSGTSPGLAALLWSDGFFSGAVCFARRTLARIAFQVFKFSMFFLSDSNGAHVCKSCRSRQELSNEHLLAKFGVDTVENGSIKICKKLIRS